MKIAVLGTSRARRVIYNPDGSLKEAHASERLLELLEGGYEVYIVSTRERLYPEGCDKCLFEVLPQENLFHADPSMDTDHAQSPGLIDLWERVLAHLEIDDPTVHDRHRSWMDLRYAAKDAGVVVY